MILLVDDEQNIISSLTRLLRKENREWELKGANSVEEARRIVEGKTPDLIILDLMMPGVDGLTYCKELRSVTKTSMVPVIMLTGRNNIDDKINAFEAGASDYVTKPFEDKELLARVRSNLALTYMRQAKSAKQEMDTILKFIKILQDDLNSPLSVLLGHLDSLEKRQTLSGEEIENAIDGCRQMAKEIDQVLDKLA